MVEDNGIGIPPEDIENIFSLFVSHKGSRGTGLGLPVSEKIVKEHGGRITSTARWAAAAVHARIARQL